MGTTMGTGTTDAVQPRRLRLFVYGTLQPGGGTPMGDWVAARLIDIEPATVPGRLLAIREGDGWFPALLPARGGEQVRGTMCTLRLTPADLAFLDRYEGGEYRRVARSARSRSGRRIAVQLYAWRVAIPPACPTIAGGDFRAWLRAGRRRAFS
jgi:gamma-glutamylcyclotransferase (GGCT)/AIG2-like uncharacterized protein YtfP